MRTLVIGGTRFIGRHIVEALLERGHEITLFNRGETNPDLFPDLEHLRGDRREDLSALERRKWDCCIDACAYLPRDVRSLLDVLNSNRYLLISTISVYADFSRTGITEDAPLATLDDPNTETVDGETYGPLKALCEREAERFDGGLTIIRPGIVCGPYDYTNRFEYWVTLGEQEPVPTRLGQPVQLIDARDLAAFIAKCATEGIDGTYNAAGESLSFKEMLLECGHEEPFPNRTTDEDMPLVLPANGSEDGTFEMDSFAAWEKGLNCRELHETTQDVRDWLESEHGAPAQRV